MTPTSCARSLALVALVGAGGCVDLSPVDFEAPEGGAPDSAKDAVTDGPSAEALAAGCQTCLSMGLCVAPWTSCAANSVCLAFAECVSATMCWSSSLTDLSNLSPCLITCAAKGGITSQNDPASLLVAPLLVCAQDPARCGPECVPGVAQDP